MAKNVKLEIPLDELSAEAKAQLLEALLKEQIPAKAKQTLAFAKAAKNLGFHGDEFVAVMADFRNRC